jgi:hypothetical protein
MKTMPNPIPDGVEIVSIPRSTYEIYREAFKYFEKVEYIISCGLGDNTMDLLLHFENVIKETRNTKLEINKILDYYRPKLPIG